MGEPVRPDANAADAALARSLIQSSPAAVLGVSGADGLPYTALTAPAAAADGAFLILASDLAAHGRALRANGGASLLFAASIDPDQPLKTARLAVSGRATLSDADRDRVAYLARRPEAALYIDFGDMRLYRLKPSAAHLVAGFGRAVVLDPAKLAFPL